MRWLFSRRWFQVPVDMVLLLAAGLLACAWYTGIWSWHDLRVYRMMSRECHPVWNDLYWGRIAAGQDVEEVVARTQPPRVERLGDWVTLSYQGKGLCFTGVTVIAREGKLVAASAWSCTWSRKFFDTLPLEEWRAYSVAVAAELSRSPRAGGTGAALTTAVPDWVRRTVVRAIPAVRGPTTGESRQAKQRPPWSSRSTTRRSVFWGGIRC